MRVGGRRKGPRKPQGRQPVLPPNRVQLGQNLALEPIGGRDLVELRALAAAAGESEMTYEEREAAADWSNGLAR